MKALKNLKAGIPPKARLMIAVTGSVVVIFALAIVKMTGGGGEAARENQAGADVRINPSARDIGRYTPGDDIIIPEDSDMARTIAAEREREMEEALQRQDVSLTESIIIPRTREQEAEEVEDNNARVLEELDQALARRAVAEEQERRVRQQTYTPVAQTQPVGPVFDRAAWFAAERERMGNNLASLDTHAQRVTSDIQRERAPGVSSGTRRGGQADGREGSVSSYIDTFTTTPSRADDRPAPATMAERLDHYYGVGAAGPAADASPTPSRSSSGSGTGRFMQAGTILYAVLHTSVNSDNTTHVRATVVQEGPFKDAVALGTVNRQGTAVTLNFSTLGHKGEDITINAVAVDPTKGSEQTVLADKVDRHIIQRYGLLWASAFAEGFADALSNTSTVINTDGSQSSTSERLPDTRDQVLVATGKVGERTVPLLSQNFNRPPTVHVNGGRPIGLMLLTGIEY